MIGVSIHPSIDDAWSTAIVRLRQIGRPVESRVGKCKELTAYSFDVVDPTKCWLWSNLRNADPNYAAAELLWYLSGDATVDKLAEHAPSYVNYVEADGKAHGAYGARWAARGHIHEIAALLKRDHTSRQAVMTTWCSEDLRHALAGDKKDLPCTLSLQFLLRDDKLDLIVTMRSNDAWLGMPYDVWCFSMLQRLVAAELRCSLGSYRHQVGSLHLYAKDEEKIKTRLMDDALFQSMPCGSRTNDLPWKGYDKRRSLATAVDEAVKAWKTNAVDAELSTKHMLDEVVLLATKKMELP